MDNSALLEPLLSQENGYSKSTSFQRQITALTPPVYQENKTELFFSSLKQTMNDISTHLRKTLPVSFYLPFTVEYLLPLSDGVHYLAQTNEGAILYIDILAQTFVDKKISESGWFSLVFFEEKGVGYFKRENEIFSIKIPSFEVNKFWSFEEGRKLLRMEKYYDQKTLVACFSDEILLFDFSDSTGPKTMFSGDFKGFTMSRKGQIALASPDNQLTVLSESNEKVGEIPIDPEFSWASFSPKGSMVIIGKQTKLTILNAYTLETLQEIELTYNQWGLFAVTSDEKILVYPDQVNLYFYDLQNFKVIETINIDNVEINFVELSADDKQVFVTGNYCDFYVLNFPTFDFQKSIKIYECEQLDESTIIFVNYDKFQTWNFITNEIKFVANIHPTYWSTQSREYIFVINDEINTINKVHIPTGNIYTKTLDKNTYETMWWSCSSPDGKYLVTGSKKRIFLWDFESMTIIKEFKGFDSWTREIHYLPKSNALAGISDNQILRIWDLDTTKEIATIHEKEDNEAMNITHNEEIIILYISNGTINFWNWRKNIRLHSLQCSSQIEYIFVTKDDRFIICYSNPTGEVIFISLETFNKIFSYKYNILYYGTTCGDGNYYFYAEKYKVAELRTLIVKENPLKMSKMTFAGPGNKYEYMKYVSKLINNQEVDYNQEMDNWAIFPYMINTLHLYAYFNYPNHLKLALKNGSSMINTIYHQNPLSIAIHKGFSNCVSTIILSLGKYLSYHPYSLTSLSNSTLIKLNLSNCNSLLKFYEALFRKDTKDSTAKFCSTSTEK